MWIWQESDWPRGRLDPSRLLGPLGATQATVAPLVSQGAALTADQRLRLEATLLGEEIESSARLSGVALERSAIRTALHQALGLADEGPGRPVAPMVETFVDVTLEAVRTAFMPLGEARLREWHRRLAPQLPRSAGQAVGEWRDGPFEEVSGRYGIKRLRYRAPGADRTALAAELEGFFTRLESEEPGLEGAGHLQTLRLHAHWSALSPFALGNGLIGRLLLARWLTRAEGIMALQAEGELAALPDAATLEPYAWRRQALAPALVDAHGDWQALREACFGRPPTPRSRLDAGLPAEAEAEPPGDLEPWVRWWLARLREGARGAQAHFVRVRRAERLWLAHARTPLNARQRELVLTLLERDDGAGVARSDYRALVTTSDPTAARDLSDLVAKGVLQSTGVGRGTRYRLPALEGSD
ncbi:DUF4172 domain-containing protein [Halomonas sp. YLGW01]|uniref:Fic family protein n=1 Tax=Halomonas sp. YLGW01 TaxID=2773308 RepID=UPI00177D2CD5|nr:DUF4172 domain-containing protein [Halomonas sp. YLGW01]